MPDDQPVMTALAEITAVSLLHSDLPAREHMIARLAATRGGRRPDRLLRDECQHRGPNRDHRGGRPESPGGGGPHRGHGPDRHRCRADHRGPRVRHRTRCRRARRQSSRPRKQPRRRQTSAEDRRGTPVSMGALVPRSRQTVDQPDRQADREPAAIHQVVRAVRAAALQPDVRARRPQGEPGSQAEWFGLGDSHGPRASPSAAKAPALRARRRRRRQACEMRSRRMASLNCKASAWPRRVGPVSRSWRCPFQRSAPDCCSRSCSISVTVRRI